MPNWDERRAGDRETVRVGLGHRGRQRRRRGAPTRSPRTRRRGAAKPLGLWADTWRRLKRNKLALVGLGIIIVFLLVGTVETVFAGALAVGTAATWRPY